MKLFVNNKGKGWFTTCKGKDLKTAKESAYFLNLQFRKGQDPVSNYIEVKDCFFTSYFRADGTTAPKLVIMDYEPLYYQQVVDGNKSQEETVKEVFGDNKVVIESEELPFY